MRRPLITGLLHKVTRSPSGLTILEVLIALLTLGLVSIAALSIYNNQQSQYLQQSDVTDMQQNIRVVMDELTRQVRQAGYGAPGSVPVEILGSGHDVLRVRFHDGSRVRSQTYFLQADSGGRENLMSQLDGEAPQMLAEGIDSLRFESGGTGGGIDWVTISIAARSRRAGFQSVATDTSSRSADGTEDRHLYRRLTSTVKLRNR